MKHDVSGFGPQAYGKAAYGAVQYAAASREEVEDRVRRFLPLVHRAAWHIYGSGRDGLEVEDLVQSGILALTECAQRHDGPTEDGFAAYAKIRVRGAMFDLIRKQMHDTRTARKKRARVVQVIEEYKTLTGTEPSRDQIAKALGISDAELLEIEASAVTLTSISDTYDESNSAFASEEPDPFDILSGQEDRERLVAAMGQLPERLMLVLQLFFVEELNLTEIAEVLEVSVPRVHQLRAKALKDLRAILEG
ncbi:sigma-70 family RNA polymerase sigma factor [Erythrobacter sp. SCSIO 43205]|uniref:sigma-70 family RNA polymerase sigma factor n=1 Tax=Erythrobacter sp. SCSIO 43205 TaxID=2779361 RepID=UPI001CA8E73D|nr:sigma-70 family RNA polymerase sigma factor [Erythrobacter sp. SCSIO 43205]UAB78714.1 sigma-70 family RNA polymerase sigma factor [Erythrobacter sp. SCSIO 43205]